MIFFRKKWKFLIPRGHLTFFATCPLGITIFLYICPIITNYFF